ncbi:MAG TPA: hypothetical protein PKH77_20090 [Anaerolineae bacterium]|nr:hypothetical protein [Anaerolineae bacterium]
MNVKNLDKWLFWGLRFIDKNENWLLTLISGFLLGRFTNEFSPPNSSLADILNGTFSVIDRPANYLSWLSVILLIAIPLLHRYLRYAYRKKKYIKIFESILNKHRSRIISHFPGLAWDEALSLQTCPELHRGWAIDEISIQQNTTRFSLPTKYQKLYADYLEKNKDKLRFFDDGVKVMLTKTPVAFSDSPTLVLDTQETLYSQIQFYRDNVVGLSAERNTLIHSVIEGSVLFPHSLSMHAIVVASDDKILLTKRSPKVSYYPNTWSCSAEEQFSLQDFQNRSRNCLTNWAERLLSEELGLTQDDYTKENLRVLAVFLESDILNISLCVHITLNIQYKELNQRLFLLPRTDYEFAEWAFVTHEDLASELLKPSRIYHPSSGYRMLMALIKRYGEPVVAEKFLRSK